MVILSFRNLAFAWTGVAATGAIGATVLQASYVPPPPPPVAVSAPVPVATPPAPVAAAAPAPVAPPAAVPLPFQNHSLLALLPPPDVRPRPVPHAGPRLPVPPAPPPMRIARLEAPRRVVSVVRRRPAAPVYVADPSYPPPPFGWGRPLPFPGQYVLSRRYDGGPVIYEGW